MGAALPAHPSAGDRWVSEERMEGRRTLVSAEYCYHSPNGLVSQFKEIWVGLTCI